MEEKFTELMKDALEKLSVLPRSEMHAPTGEGGREIMIALANRKTDAIIVAPVSLHSEWRTRLTIRHRIISPQYMLRNKVSARGLFVIVDIGCYIQSEGRTGRCVRSLLAGAAGFCVRYEDRWAVQSADE